MKLVAHNLRARLTPALPFPLECGERILLEQGMLNPAGRSSDPLWRTTLITVLPMLGDTVFLLWHWQPGDAPAEDSRCG